MVTITESKPRLEASGASVTVSESLAESRSAGVPTLRHTRARRAISDITHAVGGRRTAFAASFGSVIVVLWLTLFTVGLSVPTAPYRERLLNLANPAVTSRATDPSIVESLVVIAFAFTPTNLALLCMVSALAGCLGRLATTDDAAAELARHRRIEKVTIECTDSTSPVAASATSAATATESTTVQQASTNITVSPLAPAITAVTWGFFIYLVIVSGTVVLTGDPFKDTSPEQYLRLAGAASLLAFAVGWQPQILAQLVSNVGSSKLLKTP